MSRRNNAASRCMRCRMHSSLCVCSLIPKLDTRTRLILVIHRAEDRKPTNTGRLAFEAMPNSEVIVRGRAEQPVDIRTAKALPGRHNHQNIAAAYAACRALDLDPSDILSAIETFPGLPHRLENIGAIDGVRFINDSKATNAQAAEQAIRAFPNAWWIVGGRPKEEGIDDLVPLFGQIRKAYLIGESTEAFARALTGKLEHSKCRTMDVAVLQAFEDARASGVEGAVVLFSPACASFDQYRDFEQRGLAFRQEAANLVKRRSPTEPV